MNEEALPLAGGLLRSAETRGFEPLVPERGLHLSGVGDVCRRRRSRVVLDIARGRFGATAGHRDPADLDTRP